MRLRDRERASQRARDRMRTATEISALQILPVDHAVRMGRALFVTRLIYHCAAVRALASATFELNDQVEYAQGDEDHHQQRD